MPYEPIQIEGARLVLVRTDAFESTCEPGKRVLVPAPAEWALALPGLINTGPDGVAAHDTKLLKHSPTNTVSHVQFTPLVRSSSLVCKRRRGISPVHRLSGLVRGSRERRSFRTALRVLDMGIPTAAPVALIERGWPHFDGWLLIEHVGVMCDLDHLCLTGFRGASRAVVRDLKAAIIDGIIQMFEAFRRHGWFHRDMKASNVIVFGALDRPGEVRVGLLDLEGLRRWGGRSLLRWRNALVRLAASLKGYEAVTRTDYLRFLLRYLKTTAQAHTDWKTAYRSLGADTERYVARSSSRKKGTLDAYQ